MTAKKKPLTLEALTLKLDAQHNRNLDIEMAKAAKNLKKAESVASKRIAKAEAETKKAVEALTKAKEQAKKKQDKTKKKEKKERAAAAEKSKYKIDNWSAYNKSLINRGKISIWLSDDVLNLWRTVPKMRVVGEEQYPSAIIELCLTLQSVYHLPLRQTTGFVSDLLALMGHADLPVPDYSTLSRRQATLMVQVSTSMHGDDVVGIAIDGTGLKVYGEGEWKVRQHGFSKHRMWKKMHIAINIKTQEVLAVSLTSNGIHDSQAAVPMLEEIRSQVKRIESSHNDGAYDKFEYREALGADVIQVIPPPKNAVLQVATAKKPVPDYLEQRNKAVEYLEDHERDEWKEMVGYHLRSLNEVVMFRYKIIFDSSLHARNDANQETEATLKCKILNVFRKLGMPVSRKVV